jgi:hypothetical protein
MALATKEAEIIKVLTDDPVSSISKDVLNFDKYSSVLSEIIMDSEPRFAIGIFGSWGTGKTSLMKMVESKLRDKYADYAVTVWFEAWRYDRDKYLALIPFLQQFLIKLENVSKSKKKWAIVKKGIERTLTALTDSVELSAGYGSNASLKFDIRNFKNSLRSDGSTHIDGQEIQFQEHPTDHMRRAIAKVRKGRGGNDKFRIVVFIDDLDRCTPDKALEVLESIKAFLDIDGIVYLVAMDSHSIDSIVKNKFGKDSAIKGIDYLQKIVQLPFQVPTWIEGLEDDKIINSIVKILNTELKGYSLVHELEKNIPLIIKAVQLNPREVKRFINKVILAQSVFSTDTDPLVVSELICVQALSFHDDWKDFLDIIAPDESRGVFLRHYMKFKDERIPIPKFDDVFPEDGKPTQKGVDFLNEIDRINDELLKESENDDIKSRIGNKNEEIKGFYREYVKQGKGFKKFLETGADMILLEIKKMGKYLTAIEATKHKPDTMKLAYSCWRYPKKDDEFKTKMYAFQVIIDAPKSILEQIEYVIYKLPSWPKDHQIQKVDNRERHFELKELAYGPSTIYAEVKLKGQDNPVTLSHPIILTEEGERLL